MLFHDESAVVFDEDDQIEEDFVPSSLSDLLTPQERERRGSRPSSMLHQTNPFHGSATTDLWASSSPRYPRHSFSDLSQSPMRVLEPIGTPDRSSIGAGTSNGIVSSSARSFNYMNMLSPVQNSSEISRGSIHGFGGPQRAESDRAKRQVAGDSTPTVTPIHPADDDDTQFFMDPVDQQSSRLNGIRLG
jgi:hypothetical protein